MVINNFGNLDEDDKFLSQNERRFVPSLSKSAIKMGLPLRQPH